MTRPPSPRPIWMVAAIAALAALPGPAEAGRRGRGFSLHPAAVIGGILSIPGAIVAPRRIASRPHRPSQATRVAPRPPGADAGAGAPLPAASPLGAVPGATAAVPAAPARTAGAGGWIDPVR